MKKLSIKGEKVFETIFLVISVTVALIFWNTYLVYPVKLFVVLLHELSHGITVLISGGNLKEIEVSYQLGGFCVSKGGNELAISLSGYLGSLLFGSLIFLSASNSKLCKFMCYVLAFMFISVAIFLIKGWFGVLFSLGFAVILILLNILPFDFFRRCFVKILGTLSCLYIIFDVKNDLITTEFRDTDAMTLERITGFPSLLWGIIILIITLIVFFFLLKFNFNKRASKKAEFYEETVEEE